MPIGRGLVVVAALVVVGLALYMLTLEPTGSDTARDQVSTPRGPAPAAPMDRHDERDREALRDVLREDGRR